MLFQLPFIDYIGQVDGVYDKEKKSSHLPVYKGNSPSSSSVIMNSYFSKREQSVDKYSKETSVCVCYITVSITNA